MGNETGTGAGCGTRTGTGAGPPTGMATGVVPVGKGTNEGRGTGFGTGAEALQPETGVVITQLLPWQSNVPRTVDELTHDDLQPVMKHWTVEQAKV